MMRIFSNSLLQRLRLPLALLALLTLLGGCVTTEYGGVGSKADPQKALKTSVQLARNYIREGNWEAAKRHLKAALELDDSNAEIYEAMALVFENTGELELAEKNYRKSLRLDPGVSRVHNNFAAFLYSQKRYEDAAEQLETVVGDTLYRNRAQALYNLGRCYIQLDKWDKAEEDFRRSFLLDRRNVLVIYELANVYFHQGDYPKSQRFYDEYRSKVKQQPPQALWLGIRLAHEFRNRDAMSSYALALKNLYPTSKEYLEYLREFGNDS